MTTWERITLVALVALAIAAGFWAANELDRHERDAALLQGRVDVLVNEAGLMRGHLDAALWDLAVMEGQVAALQEQVNALAEGPCCLRVNVRNKTVVNWR